MVKIGFGGLFGEINGYEVMDEKGVLLVLSVMLVLVAYILCTHVMEKDEVWYRMVLWECMKGTVANMTI